MHVQENELKGPSGAFTLVIIYIILWTVSVFLNDIDFDHITVTLCTEKEIRAALY